jgi:hypothetical protein
MRSYKKRYVVFAIEGENVPTFAVNMKHSDESDPLFNAEVKKGFKEMLGEREEARGSSEEAWSKCVECLDFNAGSSRFLRC